MKQIPFLLILFRLFVAPVMLVVAYFQITGAGIILASLLIAGILSDVFDGIIARRLNISTDSLRKWDSHVDTVFLISTIISAWLMFPVVVMNKQWYILSIVAFELLAYLICFLRFRKLPSNHSYSSKLFAVFITVCLATLFISNDWGVMFYIMYLFGVLAYLDNFLILLLLKEYKVDTKGFWKAR